MSLTALSAELHSSGGVAKLRALVQAAFNCVVVRADDLIGEDPATFRLPVTHYYWVNGISRMRRIDSLPDTSLILPFPG